MTTKVQITPLLVANAIYHLHLAHDFHGQKSPIEEIQHSLGAFLMISLAVEGIANEAGEVTFDKWTWKKLERSEPALKWKILSGAAGRKPFSHGQEPLQTIIELTTIRNSIAHPKPIQGGDEIIIRPMDGSLKRNVSVDQELCEGDTIHLGLGSLLDDYNFTHSVKLVHRGIRAIKRLSDHLELCGIEWIDKKDKELTEATKKWNA